MSARRADPHVDSGPDELAPDVAAIAEIPSVDTILQVVCRTTGMGFAAVARVTEERWVACAVRDEISFGLKPGGELEIGTTICNEIRQSRREVVIDHVAQDQTFCGHPTPARYGFQSYISVPILLPNGTFFGTLCAIDPNPAQVSNPAVLGMFKLFAELIACHLDAHDRLQASEVDLSNARQAAELREQFIAVLGHDLRNPLASLQSGAEMLVRTPLSDKALTIVGRMQKSIDRMSGLIDDVLDFARGRLGGGLVLDRMAAIALLPTLEQVVAECASAWPHRQVQTDFTALGPVTCDPDRIGQLLSNLLGNALTHGRPDGIVRVAARSDETGFELFVSNDGEPIPEDIRNSLFKPYVRAGKRTRREGLGLGLYIASEIARAQGGTLGVESGPVETRFTFRMPLA
jgi:signal transduction histidine kinase